jgi:hypothetical protein
MRWSLVAVMLTGLVGRAGAESPDDMLGPREIAVGEALRGGSVGASAIGMNPAGLPLNRELVFEGGYGYRGTDDASMFSASICDSTNVMPGCFFYGYMGANPELGGMTGKRRAHVGGIALSRMVVPRVLVGTTTRYYDFESTMTGDRDANGVTFDIGATVRLTQLINMGIVGQNLWSSDENPEFPRTVGGGLMARPIQSLTMTFDARWKLDGNENSARFGGGVEWFLRTRNNAFPIRLGGVRDNNSKSNYVSGGLGFATMRWGIDVGGRRQFDGGNETLVIASMRFWGPRMPAPSLADQPGMFDQ